MYARVPTPWDPTQPPKNQIIGSSWGRRIWRILQDEPDPVHFRFQNRHWEVYFDRRSQLVDWNIKPNVWYVLPDEDYFPRGLRDWLKGRCFSLLRYRRGPSGGGLEGARNGYITEDGQIFYVAEDGSTFYVQETT